MDRVEKLEKGQYQVFFRDDTSLTTSKLVGADGAWSKVRKVLTDITPHYTGYTFIETYLHDVDNQYPETAKVVGQGQMFALSPGKGIVAHREYGVLFILMYRCNALQSGLTTLISQIKGSTNHS